MPISQPAIENDFDIDISGLEVDEPDSSNKTVVRYQPHGTCAKLFSLRDPEIIISGPAGTGKSFGCLHKLHLMALKYHGFRGLICRKSRSSLTQTAMITFENGVLHPLDGVVFVGMTQEYRYPNGSIIVVGGMDKASKVMSSEYDCVVAETLVSSPSAIQRGYSRPYSGKLITITTARGNQLTGTPNHPILTDKGWIALGSLCEGDYVISRTLGEQEVLARPQVDVTDQPTPIADVIRALSLSESSFTDRVKTIPMDFHGDGTYGHVDIISADGLLHHPRKSSFNQHVLEVHSERRNLEYGLLAGSRSVEEGFFCCDASRISGGCTFTENRHSLLVDFGMDPLLRSAQSTRGKLSLPRAVNVSNVTEGLSFGGRSLTNATDCHFFDEPSDADVNRFSGFHQPEFPFEVAPDRVINVFVADSGSGRHVYNLQTADSWYVANGIISHNCIYIQEATELSEPDWEALTTRLRNNRMPYQQIIGDCNPDSPTHWIKLRSERKQLLLLESRHEDNPTVTPEYLAKLDCLTGVRLLRLRHGIWAAAEGMVYEMWDPNIHVIPRFKIPNDWPRYWSIDFGFTNPFVWQCWAEDNDGRVYLYREMYVTRHLVEDLARDMLRIVGWQNEDGRLYPVVHGQSLNLEPLPQAIICDHDTEDRATLERHLGMPTRPAYKPISIGIQAVASRLNKQADGKPRLFIFDDALIQPDPSLHESRKPVCTADEFLGYVWDKGRSGDGTLEKPIKRDDHGLDSLRYLISHLERLSELDNVETGYFVMDDKVSISRF